MLDATRLLRGRRGAGSLWIGGRAPIGFALRHNGFDAVVLCAEEHQPPRGAFRGIEVIRCPFDDAERLRTREISMISHAATKIAKRVAHGKHVLVTCMAGRNRSGLVTALAIHILTGEQGRDVAKYVQHKRIAPDGYNALTNDAFVQLLNAL